MPKCITKRQVLAILAVYAVTRGVIDELKPSDETSSTSEAFDKVAFDASMDALDAKVAAKEGR